MQADPSLIQPQSRAAATIRLARCSNWRGSARPRWTPGWPLAVRAREYRAFQVCGTLPTVHRELLRQLTYVWAHCGQGTILMSRLGSTRGTEARCGKSPRAWRKRRRCMRGYPPGLLGRASLPSQPRPPRPIHSTPVRQAESARKTPHGRKPAGGNLAGGSGLKPRRHRARAPPASRRSRAMPKPSRARARARARARRHTVEMLRRRPRRLSQIWSRQQGILRACARPCATRSMRSIDGRLLR